MGVAAIECRQRAHPVSSLDSLKQNSQREIYRSFICTTFGKLILGKIIKIVATRCHILQLKCTKFDFSWGSAPDPAGGAYSAPPDPWLDGFKGPTSRGRERSGGRTGCTTH